MNYEDLHEAVRHWGTKGDVYDVNGVVHLLIAALDNLNEHALAAELDDISESFEPAQALFLIRLADRVKTGRPG